MRLLSKHGADLNAQDEDGWTSVYTTAASEDIEEGVRVELLKVLHELGANIETPTKGTRTFSKVLYDFEAQEDGEM